MPHGATREVTISAIKQSAKGVCEMRGGVLTVRRFVALASSLAMVFAAAACGDGAKTTDASTTTKSTSTAGGDSLAGTLTVMAPGPLKKLLGAAKTKFESENPGVTVQLNLGHVPTLLTQIEGGVPADVLVTPDAVTMGQASKKGMVSGKAEVIARSPMALVVPAGNPAGVKGVESLAVASLRVGVCAMELPCGKLSGQLAKKDSILLSADTLEPGGSAAIVTKASTGEIDVGLVFATDTAAGGTKVATVAIPESSNVSSQVSAAALSASTNATVARAFVDFLSSSGGLTLATEAGFLKP